jgi:hypothetical protein
MTGRLVIPSACTSVVCAVILGLSTPVVSATFKVVHKDTQVEYWVDDSPVLLARAIMQEQSKPKPPYGEWSVAWIYLGIDGSDTLRLQERISRGLRQEESVPRVEIFIRGQEGRGGIWKVFFFSSYDYIAELEVQDLGDSRVKVKLLNPPKGK